MFIHLFLSSPPDKNKPGEHKGIAFITFTSSSGLVQALSRGGDELLGMNISVKRRLPKSNSSAPLASSKKGSADLKPSYYTNQRDTNDGSSIAENEEKSGSSFPKSRFSASSSSSALPPSSDVISHGSNGTKYGKNNSTETDSNSNSTHKIEDKDMSGTERHRGGDANTVPRSSDRKEGVGGDNYSNRKRVRSSSRSPTSSSSRRDIKGGDRDRERRSDDSPDKGMRAGSHLDDDNAIRKNSDGARRDSSKNRRREGEGDRGRDRSSDRGRDRSSDRRRDRSSDKRRERNGEKGSDRGRERSSEKGRDRGRERSNGKGRDRERERSSNRGRDRVRERSNEKGRERSSDRRRDSSRERRRDHKDGLRAEDWTNDKNHVFSSREKDRNMDRGREERRGADGDRQHELYDSGTNNMKNRSKTEKSEVVGDKGKADVQRTAEDRSDNDSSSSSSDSGDSGSASD